MSHDLAPWAQQMTEDIVGGPPVQIGKRYAHPVDGLIEITSGQYWGTHGLSNFWHWTILATGKESHGYGDRWPEVHPAQPYAGDAHLVKINTPAEMRYTALFLGVQPNWHEPDEQGVSARIIGDQLDNAMGSTLNPTTTEINIVLTRNGQDVAVVNLATLLAFATSA